MLLTEIGMLGGKASLERTLSLVVDVLYLSYLSLIQVKKLQAFKKNRTRMFVVI